MATEGRDSGEQSLVKTRDFWEAVAHVCGWLVAIGLVVEAVVIFRDNALWSARLRHLSGTFLVLVGVAGEVVFGARAGKFAEAIRALSKENVAKADARAAEADRKAAEANAVAEENRLERIRLEAKLAPRTMSLEEVRKVSSALQPFSGVRADIQSFGQNFPEVTRVCRLLANVLHNTGWTVNIVPPPDPPGAMEGIFVGVDSAGDEKTRRAKDALIVALNAVGWEAGEYRLPLPLPSFPHGLIDTRILAPLRVMVGFKPDLVTTSYTSATSANE